MNQSSTMTARGVNLLGMPDYEPSLSFGQLVELESLAGEVRQMLSRIDVRFAKALRLGSPRCPESCNPVPAACSQLGEQIASVRDALRGCLLAGQDIIERADL